MKVYLKPRFILEISIPDVMGFFSGTINENTAPKNTTPIAEPRRIEVVIKLETIPFCSNGADVIMLFVFAGIKNPIEKP